MTDQPQPTVHFEKCGACGSEKLLAQGLAAEMIERGLVGPTFRFSLQEYTGLPLDQAAQERLPFGATIPGIKAVVDGCAECGTLRIIRYDRTMATKQPPPEKLTKPILVPPGVGNLRAN